MKQHRQLPAGAHIFGATICSDCYGAKYYVEIYVRIEQQMVETVPLRYSHVLGLDYTQDGLYVDSTGKSAGYPAYQHQASGKLACCRQTVRRFHPGSSHRWRKFNRRLAKIKRHVCN